MSEKILQALMQLFAIGGALEKLTLQSRHAVEIFLRQQVSQQRVQEYLILYDNFVAKLEGGEDSIKARKKIAGSSVKMLRICSEINKELNTRQKYIVFLRLVEFMQTSSIEITSDEKDFLQIVSDVFSIDNEEYELCVALTRLEPDLKALDSSLVLFVENEKTAATNAHHITVPENEGRLILVNMKKAQVIFMRYTGSSTVSVNGQPVDVNFITVLSQGAVVRGSRLQSLYFSTIVRAFLSDNSVDHFRFTVNDLVFKFPNGRTGIHPLSFSVESGTLAGIMGSSGAGKSTLLNILNGSCRPSSGTININGVNLFDNKSGAEEMVGNIPQDDLLIEELTVFQNLFYNTKLCFGDLPNEAITHKVDNVLESLGLLESKNLRVGNSLNKTISGGQRKRLNIALELVREPSILFVDEPTSGLSSRDAENVMDLLKQIALSGKLVFVVIHQPSSDIFRMFDQLLMLDTGGYPVYFGNPSDALIYFKRQVHLTDAEQSECYVCGNINPEQLFNIIELHEIDEFGNRTGNRKINPREWNELYKSNSKIIPEDINNSPRQSRFKKASPLSQFKIFFTRDLLSKLSSTQYMLINLLEAPLLAVILSFILRYSSGGDYKLINNPNLPAYLFICVIVALFLGLSVSAEEIIRDRKILQRERFLHLSRTSYLLSKLALLFLISAIQTACFVVAGNVLMGIHDMNFVYWIILFSTSCFANLLGLNFSSALDSAVTVYILIPFLLIPQILLSGVIVRFEKLNPSITVEEGVPLIGNVMTSRWAFEALAVEQFANNPFEKQFFPLDAALSRATYKKDWWIAAMRERVDKCKSIISQNNSRELLNEPVALLSNEFKEESFNHPAGYFPFMNSLVNNEINVQSLNMMTNSLDSLREFYINKYNSVSEIRENRIAAMTSTPEKSDQFLGMKNRYENESLEDIVRNNNQKDRLVIGKEKIIQRFEPVFHSRKTEGFFKAPLFSSVKNLGKNSLSALTANILVIWCMTFLLYIFLQIDFFRKIIRLFARAGK